MSSTRASGRLEGTLRTGGNSRVSSTATAQKRRHYDAWSARIPKREYSTAEARLHEEILECVKYLSPTAEEQILVTYIEKCACVVIRTVSSKCEIHTSGSTATGLRLPGSDLDLIIQDEDVDDTMTFFRLFDISAAMRSTTWCQDVSFLSGARVPIVTFSTKPEFGSIKVDISINSTDGLRNGAFVKESLKNMPTLKPLVLLIKKTLSQHDLNDAPNKGINSFAVICMCISFLQLNPYKLPEAYFKNPMESKSLGFILLGFLKWYSRGFSYERMYISVSRARLLPKLGASWITWYEQSRLVVQCPRDPRRNVARSLSQSNFEKMRSLFTQKYDVLAGATAASTKILSHLVYVDDKFLEYRKHVQKLSRSGEFAKSVLKILSSQDQPPPKQVSPPDLTRLEL